MRRVPQGDKAGESRNIAGVGDSARDIASDARSAEAPSEYLTATQPPRSSVVGLLFREWPYITMLALALFGVGYTSVSQQGMTWYWIAITPFFALVCVIVGWRGLQGARAHWHLIQMQALHWLAVILAISLVFVSDVEKIMNSDATALMVLTILALGTFTAGIQVASWRICIVGIVLGLGVPSIAWLEESTVLIVLSLIVVVTVGLSIYLHNVGHTKEISRQSPL